MAVRSAPNIVVRDRGDHEWEFDFPRIDHEAHERFYAAAELLDYEPRRAIPAMRKLVREFPEFIDALHHLGVALEATGNQEAALQQWTAAAKLGLDALPRGFCFGRDRLSWGFLDNRPFLRAYHAVALVRLEQGLAGEAWSIFRNILDLNPDDNQGIRYLIAGVLFDLRRPGDVLDVCKRYRDDGAQLMYGRALALHQLGRGDEARKALAKAIGAWPLVAKELAKRKHVPPADAHPGYVTVGGADEAYYYWEEFGEHWERTPGALALLRSAAKAEGPPAKKA